MLIFVGAPTAVSNLWDVTDRDIDRFSQHLLEGWLACSSLSGKHALERSPEVLQTSISWCVDASRKVCRLPHLIGAAPVSYGIPSSVR